MHHAQVAQQQLTPGAVLQHPPAPRNDLSLGSLCRHEAGGYTWPVLMRGVLEQFLRELRRMLCQLYTGDPWKA